MGRLPRDAQRWGEGEDEVAVVEDDVLLRGFLVGEGPAGGGAPGAAVLHVLRQRKNLETPRGAAPGHEKE